MGFIDDLKASASAGGADYQSGGKYLGEFGGAGKDVGFAGSGYGTFDPTAGDDGGYIAPTSDEGVANMVEAMAQQRQREKAIERNLLAQARPVTQGFGKGDPAIVQLANRIANQPLPNIGAFGFGLNTIGSTLSRGILERVQSGGKPVYDPSGQIVGVMSGGGLFGGESYYGRAGFDPLQGGSMYDEKINGYVSGSMAGDIGVGGGENEPYIAPEATAVAVAQPQEPSMVERDYIYPEGGFYPTTGRFYRPSLLDIAPEVYGGLLAGRTAPEFQEMNYAFRRPVNVGMYQDPYNLAGYQPYPETASLLG